MTLPLFIHQPIFLVELSKARLEHFHEFLEMVSKILCVLHNSLSGERGPELSSDAKRAPWPPPHGCVIMMFTRQRSHNPYERTGYLCDLSHQSQLWGGWAEPKTAGASTLVFSCQELPSSYENIIIFSAPRWRKGWRHCSKLFTFIPPTIFALSISSLTSMALILQRKQGIEVATCGIICTACTSPGKKGAWLSPLPKNVPWPLGVCLGGCKTGPEIARFPDSWAIP